MKILKYIIENGGYDEKKNISFYICCCLCFITLWLQQYFKDQREYKKSSHSLFFSLLCGQTSEKDLNEMVKTYNKDKNYCSKAYKKNKDVILISTDSQI